MRVLIACAGRSPKWQGDRPPHLAVVDGLPLLERTVGQVRRWTDDVHVTAPPGDFRYRASGATVHGRSPDLPSEYASTRDLWSDTARTVLLLGDVYWTDAAINRVLSCADPDFRVFGRYGPSKITGTPYGEIFAASFWPDQHIDLDRHLHVVHLARAQGTVTRPPGWMLLRSWQGTPLGKHVVRRPPFCDIDDETDDLDRPEDLQRHPAFRGGRARG